MVNKQLQYTYFTIPHEVKRKQTMKFGEVIKHTTNIFLKNYAENEGLVPELVLQVVCWLVSIYFDSPQLGKK